VASSRSDPHGDVGAGVAPVYRDDPRLQPLIGPGAPYEVEAVVLDGVPLRDFVRAPRTVLDVFRMGAAHEALDNVVYEGERLTFADVRRRSRSLAHELQSTFAVQAGDRVAIAMRNLPEFVVSFWGAVLVGAIAVPLNSWWAGAELGYAMRNAEVSVVVADDERIERVLRAGRPDGVTIVGVRSAHGDVPFDELTTGAPLDDDAMARLTPDDPVTLMYTSGTTGRPKGALGTSRAMIANLWNMAFVAARESLIAGRPPVASRQPATLSTGPLFHIGGMSSIVGGPIGGTKMVLMRKWDVEHALRLAREEQVTGVGGVPAVAQQVIEHPGAAGLEVRTFPMGGAAVPPDLVARALHTFGDSIQVLNGYGLTETTSAVVANVGVEFAAHPDSVGRPNLTADVRIVDADGEPLARGEVGEICIRSPQVVSGYWNDEAATKTSFTDGWFHSGDIGYVDHEGYVYVVDRMKDVVIRGGENVYCVEVEAILHEHPGVAEVAVVGLDEPTMGERVCAVVVPRAGTVVDLADLRAYASARLAGFKCPEALYVAVELPRNATGKVEKRALRAAVVDAPFGEVERLW
jgi:acyl-CoA synthetase (AMP-forming)/AMP-acid ligase II